MSNTNLAPADHATGIAQRAVQFARAARLDEFDQLPDWVTPDAHGAILAHAQGIKTRLHLLLATALLLAEKENRDCIDLALVQRAASLQTQVEPVHLAALPAAGVRHHPVWLLAVSFSIACAFLAVCLGLRLAVHNPSTVPSVHLQAAPSASGPTRSVTSPEVHRPAVPSPVPVIAPVAMPHPAPPPPAPRPPQWTTNWQPAEPTPIVIVRATEAARPRVQQLQAWIASQGWQAAVEPDRRPQRGIWVRYYYAEDGDAANRLARAALPSWVVASLVPARHGRAAPPPGTIEVHMD
jgi:hypothetical protein